MSRCCHADRAANEPRDRYRSPLCLLYPPKTIAIACYLLGQHMSEDPLSTSLDALISKISSSLPTPPSHDDASPESGQYSNDHLSLSKEEVTSVAGPIAPPRSTNRSTNSLGLVDALSIMLEFYSAQDLQNAHPYVAPLAAVSFSVSLFHVVAHIFGRYPLQRSLQTGQGSLPP